MCQYIDRLHKAALESACSISCHMETNMSINNKQRVTTNIILTHHPRDWCFYYHTHEEKRG